MKNVLKRTTPIVRDAQRSLAYEARDATRLVWDLPVRITHWLLVAGVAGCWVTHYAGVEWFQWHRRLGYAVLVLLALDALVLMVMIACRRRLDQYDSSAPTGPTDWPESVIGKERLW